MNILVLTPYLAWPADHGGRMRSQQLLRALALTHRVTNIACAAPGDVAPTGIDAGGVDIRRVVVAAAPHGLAARIAKWARLAAGRSSLLPRWRHATVDAAIRSARQQTSFDVAVIDTPWMAVYADALAGVPTVASLQNVESDVLRARAAQLGSAAAWAARRDAALIARHEVAMANAARRTIVVSQDDCNRLRRLGARGPIDVVENGIDIPRDLLPPPPADGTLLFVASFDYPPNADGADLLVRRWLPDLRAALGPVTLVLAGRDPGPATRALGSVAGVTVTGRVPDLTPYYAAAAAVIVPLNSGGGSRIKILEAFALGRPVISTRVGASGLDVVDGEQLLLAEDGAACAAAVLRLRSDAAFAHGLIARARTWVAARHDWVGIRPRFSNAVAAAAAAGGGGK